jgi:deoxyadenosine/deoxycytidine kinase
MLDKDPLFARITLTDEEYNLYRLIYDRIRPQVPTPDLVIYLQASTATLIERVRRRGTPYEQGISDEYLVRLAEGYARYFHDYGAAPVLVVNSDNLNFVDSPGDFDLLLQRATTMRGAREFFSLGN